MALVKHSVLMAKSYCIPIFKVSYNVPIINIVLRFIMFLLLLFLCSTLVYILKNSVQKNKQK